MNTLRRRAALVAALAEDAEAVLVTTLVNVRYLTGFTGSSGALLVSRDREPVLATDGRYQEQAETQAGDVEIVVTRTPAADLAARAAAGSVQHLAIEREHVTLAMCDRLREAAPGVELVDAGQVVERLRTVKDDDEIDALRAACVATDAAFADVVERLRPGVTEKEVAWQLLRAMREHGADGAAFPSIVAFGAHSAIPHHQPTSTTLRSGDLVKMDFGALVDGYHADMTRTVVCGSAARWQQELHARVLDIQSRCRDATTVGAHPGDLEELARRLIEETGDSCLHGLGHGVGLEIHEQPMLVRGAAAPPLVAGIPLTIEPGVYLPGRGGVRIEDTMLVGHGAPTAMTTSPRELLET